VPQCFAMTDSTDVKMSGGQAGRDAGLRLEESIDAVDMNSLVQSSSNAETTDSKTREGHDAQKVDGEQTSLPIRDTTQPTPSETISKARTEDTQLRQDKGKERAPRPPSPAKNDDDDIAIGASTDDIPKPAQRGDGPICHITLLISSGKRHPYKLDEKYLAKRNVSVPGVTEKGGMDPFSISVYTLKELILREWRDEWEAKPASPSSIRLIHFGKLLDDKDQLKQYKFSTEASNVVHMNVRPTDLAEDEEPKSNNKNTRDGSRNDGSRCCVIL